MTNVTKKIFAFMGSPPTDSTPSSDSANFLQNFECTGSLKEKEMLPPRRREKSCPPSSPWRKGLAFILKNLLVIGKKHAL